MKLLLDPIFTSKKISKCSTYYALKQSGLDFLNQSEDNYVYCTIPDTSAPDNEFITDELVDHPRWINVPVTFGICRYQNMFFPHNDMLKFAAFGEYWDWDILMTTRNNGWFWRFIAGKSDRSPIKKLLLFVEPFPMMTFKKTIAFSKRQDVNILNSYYGFDRVYIQTKWERDEIMNIAKKFMTPTVGEALGKRIVATFPKPQLDYDYPNNRKVDLSRSMNLIYFQRLDNFERRVDKMLEVMKKAFIIGGDIKIRLTTNSETGLVGNDSGFINFGRLPREKFYEELKSQDAFLSWSIDEGMPFSLLEAISFGVIPIVKREMWSEDFLGKEYWGLVNTKEEAVMKILWIKENREEAYKIFLTWYNDYFLKTIVARGNQFEVQRLDIEKHLHYIQNDPKALLKLKIDLTDDSLATIINNSDLKSINLNKQEEIAKLPGVRMGGGKKVAQMNIPLSRSRDVYETRLKLNKMGWKDTKNPALMVRE